MLAGGAAVALAGCVRQGGFDGDLRGFNKNIFSTSDAARNVALQRPAPDSRGIISYPGYQVAVARQGDTVDSVAARVGIPANEIARYNALQPGVSLRAGEIVALPRRVDGGTAVAGLPPATTGSGGSGGRIDVATIASGAIDRASAGQGGGQTGAGNGIQTGTVAPSAGTTTASAIATGPQPARHKVARGETAYTIARMYNVNVKALADWNGLGSDLAVREGQILLVPVGGATAVTVTDNNSLPGEGSATPVPPSASKPMPAEKPVAAAAPIKTPPAPDLGASSSSSTKFVMPVQGKIIRGYEKNKTNGIDIGAPAGTTVSAAGDGTVGAITKNTKGIPVLVIRHADNLMSIYANIDGLTVKKGDKVKRGQKLGTVPATDPAFVHFEIRRGLDAIDPMPYL